MHKLTIRPGLARTVPVLMPCLGVPTGRSKCAGYLDLNLSNIYGVPFEKKTVHFVNHAFGGSHNVQFFFHTTYSFFPNLSDTQDGNIRLILHVVFGPT